MSETRNRNFIRLGIVAGIILMAILIGYLTGNLSLVLDILGAIGLVLIGITILVTIHELGHFLTAKAFGMRVETFSIGFPPKIFGFKKGDTEYQIGATPLGGYVKITGIIDESLDTQHLNEEPKPYEFRAKPVWQRLIVMTGGVIMNIILGIVVFSMLKYTYGDFFLPMSEVRNGIKVAEPYYAANKDGDSVYVQSLGYFLGFRTGDELVSYKGQTFENFDDYINQKNLLEDDAYYEVKRNGETVKIEIPGNVQNYFSSDTIGSTLFGPAFPPIVHVEETMDTDGDPKTPAIASPAYTSGLRTGDKIVMMDSVEINRFSDIGKITRGKQSQLVPVVVERNGEKISFEVQISPEGYLGVYATSLTETFKFDTLSYGFFESFKPGTKEAFTFLFANVQGIANLSREGVDAGKSVMGPIQIASVYLKAFKEGGVRKFMELTAMLSMILAFVNILPIPALDGGHVVFLLIEAITRKEPSAKIRIISQQIGMVFILSLMLLILFNDFFRLVN
ncbi:MAG: site-2 protease family protein [Bacteroidetes bacterium]|nr:site-2 protease family protein [Bacteroidota bacterium]MCB0841762.1 site-2 protease family protein [Bacteroidota bacterium]